MVKNKCSNCVSIWGSRPVAWADISGSLEYPDINGVISFYQLDKGVLAVTEVFGLPAPVASCAYPVFGFHIHEGGSCSGTPTDAFKDTLGHYNPQNCAHPYHAGDMPPLFGNHGYAFSVFFTDRFKAEEIIDRTVVIHEKPDDFTSQPAGNSGKKIACGVIKAFI